MSNNHYQSLGVATTSSPEEIRFAYRNLARIHHPDKHEGRTSAQMLAINEAWRVLSDPVLRYQYDASLRLRLDDERDAATAQTQERLRSIVDDVAGTTRDPVDELIEIGDQVWRFIDTAGLRKRANQASGTDYYATLRTQTALERCEVAAVVLDASNPISEQDLRIITMVEEAGKAMVIVMNKWDLVDEDRRNQLDREIDRHLDQVEWAQRVNIAAKTGWHRDRLAPALRTALDSWERRVPTAKLNSFLGALIGATPPPVRGGKQPKVYYATQAGIAPPKFVVFSSGWIEASYRRFIERRLREEFKFPGTPVQVAVRVKERDKE